MRTKYIVGEFPNGGLSVLAAITFPESIPHDVMAEACVGGRNGVVSAGFFTVFNGQVEPYGESTGLAVSSRPEDASLIARAIGAHPSCR